MRIPIAVGVLATLLSACSAAPTGASEDVGRAREAITSGTVDPSDRAVVALIGPSGGTECSGTLVAPSIVLTAGHCLAGLGIDHIAIGLDSRTPGSTVAVAATHLHPRFELETLDNDIAVLELVTPVADVTPAPIEFTDSPAVGNQVRVVGFGRASGDGAGDAGGSTDDVYGTRHGGSADLSALGPTTLTLLPSPAQPCAGDSGGPVLNVRGSVIGVTSYGDPECESGATATRVDAFESFVDPWLHDVPTPASTTACSLRRLPSRARPSAGIAILAVCLVRLLRRRARFGGAATRSAAPQRPCAGTRVR